MCFLNCTFVPLGFFRTDKMSFMTTISVKTIHNWLNVTDIIHKFHKVIMYPRFGTIPPPSPPPPPPPPRLGKLHFKISFTCQL